MFDRPVLRAILVKHVRGQHSPHSTDFGGVVQWVEHLPGVRTVLTSVPSTEKKDLFWAATIAQ